MCSITWHPSFIHGVLVLFSQVSGFSIGFLEATHELMWLLKACNSRIFSLCHVYKISQAGISKSWLSRGSKERLTATQHQ